MIIRSQTWERIRDKFTEEEKDALSGAVIGQCICPQGPIVDASKLPTALRDKLTEAIKSK